ncbi:hypothetical protein [Vitreimonas flagellata]|uniref:hypothetical protein n=1 Tax=Vitreimonas flagellata TaxID=2560861 RepID=UPI001075475E|nr:hypothetical protein [Vitreimonas flagellata]
MNAAGSHTLATTPAANALETAFGAMGLNVIARVSDSEQTTDLAIALNTPRLAVIRCVERAAPKDQTALATMVSEGDFIWGAVVYEQGEPPNSPGLIESFHVSQLDQLVARLIELREACREAG